MSVTETEVDHLRDTVYIVGDPPPQAGKRAMLQFVASKFTRSPEVTEQDLEGLMRGTEFYAAVAQYHPSHPNNFNRGAFIKWAIALGLSVGVLDYLSKMQTYGGEVHFVHDHPYTLREIKIIDNQLLGQSLTPQMIDQLIPPQYRAIVHLEGLIPFFRGPLDGLNVFLDTHKNQTIEDLIFLASAWAETLETTIEQASQDHKGVHLLYPSTDAIRRVVGGFPLVEGQPDTYDGLRQVIHPAKPGERFTTVNETIKLMTAGTDLFRATVDVLSRDGVDLRGVQARIIGSLATARAQIGISDVDQAWVTEDPYQLLKIKEGLDRNSSRIEAVVDNVFKSKGLSVPAGNHLVVILQGADTFLDMFFHTLGKSLERH